MQFQLNKPLFNLPISPASIHHLASHLITGVSLALGMVACNLLTVESVTAKPITPTQSQQAFSSQTATPGSPLTLPNGTYLYGESQKPNELQKGYFVFEVNNGKVIGALYMPRSSFDCAIGQFQGKKLALTVTNSYDRSANPFEFALEKTATVATDGKPHPQLGLEGMHRINAVSKNDLRILTVCKADLEKSKQLVSRR